MTRAIVTRDGRITCPCGMVLAARDAHGRLTIAANWTPVYGSPRPRGDELTVTWRRVRTVARSTRRQDLDLDGGGRALHTFMACQCGRDVLIDPNVLDRRSR